MQPSAGHAGAADVGMVAAQHLSGIDGQGVAVCLDPLQLMVTKLVITATMSTMVALIMASVLCLHMTAFAGLNVFDPVIWDAYLDGELRNHVFMILAKQSIMLWDAPALCDSVAVAFLCGSVAATLQWYYIMAVTNAILFDPLVRASHLVVSAQRGLHGMG